MGIEGKVLVTTAGAGKTLLLEMRMPHPAATRTRSSLVNFMLREHASLVIIVDTLMKSVAEAIHLDRVLLVQEAISHLEEVFKEAVARLLVGRGDEAVIYYSNVINA